jgi:hypothetical protein
LCYFGVNSKGQIEMQHEKYWIETLLLPLDQILASLSKKTTKFMLDIKESPSQGRLSHLIGYMQII